MYGNKASAEGKSDPPMCKTEGHKTEQNDIESGLTIKEQEDVEVASREEEEEVGLVSSITIDEIQLIRKYADPEVMRSIAADLKLDNPGSVDDMDIVLVLEKERGGRRVGQRRRIRKMLKKKNPRYEELLAEKKDAATSKAEIPRLALRLLMTDVYSFAQALDYSKFKLSQFQLDHCSAASEKGTNKIIRQQYDFQKKASKTVKLNQNRTRLPKLLRECGYTKIGRAFYFGKYVIMIAT
ncbi:uncharacterized protein [Diadema antillarum]|uniref:uncharacterized protein n=1 Tax=Diadema antillarum TaxID=105358 RepID=UPI003A8B16C5